MNRLAAAPSACATCQKPLSLLDRLMGRTECATDRANSTATRDTARARYLGALTGFDLRAPLSASEERTLTETTPESLGTAWHARVTRSALTYLFEQALADDALTADEDAAIDRFARLASVTVSDVLRGTPSLAAHAAVARVNAGRLPTVTKPTVRLRRRETCHIEVRASLMTDSAGAAATSAAAGRGLDMNRGDLIAYGRVVGGLVPMPSDLRAWDDGMLLVTDQRVFFEGDHVSIQIPHRRLIGCTVFKDGLRVRIAGRRAEPIFRIADPLVVAAIASRASSGVAQIPAPKVYAVESFDGLALSPAGSSRSGSVPARE